ncbi:TetR/AcrR family transcriptional regulator [Umezawaea sp.]|uniref:TetR/AcrR family transcriptional regulator n=1 Tax=Umezawaea sp. TaxID=1955258 RepID=UPI002ED220B6
MATIKAAEQTPGRRQRSEGKRSAILDAAEALFIADGYERTSVDAVAARAGVSKRTVYDHFGDKQTVFRGVLERVSEAVTATVRTAVDEELVEGRELSEGLTAFALRVATEAFPSSSYATYRRLSSQEPSAPRLEEPAREHPERLVEERFTALMATGELRTAPPRRAVKHFTALTFLLALEPLREGSPNAEAEFREIITEGVDVFLRAYRR